MKRFKVRVRRFVEAVREYEVEAANEAEAEDKATELASNDDWSNNSGSSSDYDVEEIWRLDQEVK